MVMNPLASPEQASKRRLASVLGWLSRFRPEPNFDRLHWKLTVYYTLVSVLVVILLVFLLLGAGTWLYSHFYYGNIPSKMSAQADIIAPYFAVEQQPQEIRRWLAEQERFLITDRFNGDTIEFTLRLNEASKVQVVDAQPRLMASSDGTLHKLELNPKEHGIVTAILNGQAENTLHITRYFPLRVFSATPIRLEGRVVGSILFSEDFYDIDDALLLLGMVLLFITLITALIGTFFGFLSSRGLTRRIKKLEYASAAWRQGDFSLQVEDSSSDELGRLTERLNHMAAELASHVSTRQELAMLAERNRLALELHDSVKQQVFAIGMKVGFAEALANDAQLNQSQLQASLHDVGELAHQTQEELQRLIHELKPVALEHSSLASALERHSSAWEKLHGITVVCRVDITAEAEGEGLDSALEQALWRVAQEGLSNVAQHARATQVILNLQQSEDAIVLSIEDDGCGFDVECEGQGLGRRSMLERIQQQGGSLHIRSTLGKGTKVEACVPLTHVSHVSHVPKIV